MEYIDGSMEKPAPNDPFFKEWRSTNDVIFSWLINSMEQNVAANFNFLDTAEEVWTSAKDLYGEHFNAARIYHLSQKKANLKKGPSPISEYLGVFKSIWDEMDVYAPITNDLAQAKKLRDQDRIFEVLAGLPPDFEHLRGQILMSNDLPSLSSVFSMLIREESRRKAMGIHDPSAEIPHQGEAVFNVTKPADKISNEGNVLATNHLFKG
ncbi:hypothetical protein QML37_30600, partial [Klebsiella pneumoniae]|uniref:hypothetical protein n=1 Tax=Klebsiella pneumoniae TaxID=573 RepID=UPI003A80B2CB